MNLTLFQKPHANLTTQISNSLKIKPFILETTHGNSRLGFIINGYGFISPEDISQTYLKSANLLFEYKYELCKNSLGKFNSNSQDILENILRNVSNLELIYMQSPKPMTQKELETKKNIPNIKKVDIFNSNSHRIYTCALEVIYQHSIDEYQEALKYGEITLNQLRQIIYQKLNFEIKKRFYIPKLNPFQTLELLTSNISQEYIFAPNFSNVQNYYGSIKEIISEYKPKNSQILLR